jgi:hypothetical protein
MPIRTKEPGDAVAPVQNSNGLAPYTKGDSSETSVYDSALEKPVKGDSSEDDDPSESSDEDYYLSASRKPTGKSKTPADATAAHTRKPESHVPVVESHKTLPSNRRLSNILQNRQEIMRDILQARKPKSLTDPKTYQLSGEHNFRPTGSRNHLQLVLLNCSLCVILLTQTCRRFGLRTRAANRNIEDGDDQTEFSPRKILPARTAATLQQPKKEFLAVQPAKNIKQNPGTIFADLEMQTFTKTGTRGSQK